MTGETEESIRNVLDKLGELLDAAALYYRSKTDPYNLRTLKQRSRVDDNILKKQSDSVTGVILDPEAFGENPDSTPPDELQLRGYIYRLKR